MVDHMDHRRHDDEGAIEPVGDVDVLGLPTRDGADEQIGIGHPDQRHPERDRPFHFGVLLRRGNTQRITDQHRHDRRLPTPEHEVGQPVGDQPHLAGALHDVKRGCEQRTAAEREDHQVGVNRAQAPEGGPG